MIKVNGAPVEFFKFPDGQWHCKLDNFYGGILEASLTSFDEVIKLLLVANIYRNKNIPIIHLKINYLIGSRMDRVIGQGQPHTLKVIMDIINTIDYKVIQIVEPHSDVVEALSKGAFFNLGWEEILKLQSKLHSKNGLKDVLNNSIIVTPDAGMYKKIDRFCHAFDNFNVIEASKKRDLKTGNITATNINTQQDLKDKDCLVIDDLCDGGKTFIELGKALKNAGTKRLILAVCHGIFSKGLDELLIYYNHIYTTDSYAYIDHPKVTCIKV